MGIYSQQPLGKKSRGTSTDSTINNNGKNWNENTKEQNVMKRVMRKKKKIEGIKCRKQKKNKNKWNTQ
jgi:hypothetical protein